MAVRAFRDEPSLAAGRVSGRHQILVIYAPRARSRLNAALTSARWVSAWGEVSLLLPGAAGLLGIQAHVVLAEPDPRKALMLWVQSVTDTAARITPLGEVLIAAADIDPAAAQLLAEANRNRMLGATVFVRYLASLDGLAAGMTEQRAAELCWALTDGHLYRLLVAQRSWSTADFNRWLSDSLTAALLPT